ncbi:MAG TPA: DUF3488 and transglutaminase-like domain-containing protein [Bryobacteraceae bacterium]|nr:DUF3488 and transglutaminase-like domain-containing protein [Bryobacteraceae bacterium]
MGCAARTAAIPRTIDRFFEFSLLGMLAAGFFAVAGSGYLDWPTATLTLIALCLRGLMVAGVAEIHLSNRFIAILTLIYIVFWPIDYFFVSESFLTATVHLVCFLASIKILTAKTNRDYTYIKMIAVLELLAAAVLSISLSFFAYLALFLLLAIAAFSSGEVRRSAQLQRSVARGALSAFPRRLVLLSASLFTGILVMTAAMFFVLPRTARAALDRFVPPRYHLPGFSSGITLGEIGEIKKSSVPVMHVMAHPEGPLNVRWHGGSLSYFDGKRWFNPRAESQREILPIDHGVLMANKQYNSLPARRGHDISYNVQVSDADQDTLFLAGAPGTIAINAPFLLFQPASGAYTIAPSARPEKLEYAVYSFLADPASPALATPEPLTAHERRELLELPRNLDPRIPRLALEMSAGARTEMEKARDIENELRRNYGYTLQLLPKEVPDPLATFLFERKKGHCEYFASAMAVMLRSEGIPARVATGFQSGIYNPLTHQQVIRASDAHSWVEAWIAGRGWTDFDPTPADPSAIAMGFMSRMSMFFDAAQQFWQDWVVSYDLDRQIVLASRMDQSARSLHFPALAGARTWMWRISAFITRYATVLIALGCLGVVALLFGPVFADWWRGRERLRRMERGEGVASDATVLYQRMLVVLGRRGFHKPPWLTPAEFARVLPANDSRAVVNDLTSLYNEFRFGARREVAPRMMQLLERLEKDPGSP